MTKPPAEKGKRGGRGLRVWALRMISRQGGAFLASVKSCARYGDDGGTFAPGHVFLRWDSQ